MSIESGQRYKFTNEENGLVLDLSGSNGKSILGWDFHGGGNQQVNNLVVTSIACPSYDHDTLQWITERQDDGQWTVRSVRHHKYLGFESTLKDGAPLDGLDKPQLWDIEVLPDSEDHDNPRVK
jgi:hypothetical protein